METRTEQNRYLKVSSYGHVWPGRVTSDQAASGRDGTEGEGWGQRVRRLITTKHSTRYALNGFRKVEEVTFLLQNQLSI